MPITKSAAKALKQSEVKRKRNLAKKRALHYALKNADKVEDLPKTQSLIDKIAKTGYIHKNKANRLKSRLAKKISTDKTPAATPVKKAKSTRATKAKAKKK